MKAKVFDFISANIQTDNYLLLRKIVVNNVFLMVAAVILSLAAVLNTFVFYNYSVAVIDAISSLTAIYAMYNLKKTKNLKIAQIISTLNIFIFFVFFVYLTKNESFSLIWTIFVPIFIIPILGHKNGLKVALLFYAIFFVLAYINIGVWQNGEWDFHSFARVVASSIVLIYITYINELTIYRANNLLAEKEKKEKKYLQEIIDSRDKALEAEKSKDIFLANMSHEIRTPLNAILGFVDILDKESINDKHKKYLNVIKSSSDSLLAIIGDILDFAKLRSGKIDIVKDNYDLKKELQIIFDLFSKNAERKHIQYDVTFSDGFENYCYVDKVRINQIISNLLSNAIKFTPEYGTITSKVILENSTLRISVQDNGIGLTQEQLTRIFQVFEQAHGSTANDYGGTGLGLAISLKLAHLMGGDITVKSEDTKGSIFTLTLPIEVSSLPIQTTDNTNEHIQEALYSAHILVAEDNKSNQMLIKLLLEDLGISIDIANDGKEAYEFYKNSCHAEKKYDLVLMDNNMPVMDGIESTQLIKKLDCYYNTPIVALTANALKGDREYFLENGMDEYLKKPIELNELKRVLQKLLT